MKSRGLTLTTIAAFVMLTVSAGLSQDRQPKKQPPHYTVVDLGTPLGGSYAIGTSANLLGWVGGYSGLTGDTSQHAVLWQNGAVKDLGTLGGPNSDLSGTNSGFAETSGTDPLGQDFCDYGDYLICLPFVLKFDSLVALPTLGGYSAVAYINNDWGQAVGVSTLSTLDPLCLVNGQPQPPFYLQQATAPTVWTNGRATAIPFLSGDSAGQASGINDLGQVVGESGVCLNQTVHAWLWNNGELVNLGSLGGVMGNVPESINNLGEVTGVSDLAGDATSHAFLWRKGTMTDLGTLPGDYSSSGFAINDLGEIVGSSCDVNGNCRPFLWQNGKMYNLNSLIPSNSSLYLLGALDINDLGEIVGVAYDQTAGTAPAFLAVVCGDCSEGQPGRTTAATVALPENVRKLVQQHMKTGRFRGLRTPEPFTAAQ